MEVKIDSEKLLTELRAYVNLPEFTGDIVLLRTELDLGKKAEIAMALVGKVHTKIDSIIGDVGHLADDEDALDKVVGFLDDVVRLPLYLEWLDGPVIKAVLRLLANYAKKVKV